MSPIHLISSANAAYENTARLSTFVDNTTDQVAEITRCINSTLDIAVGTRQFQNLQTRLFLMQWEVKTADVWVHCDTT